LPDPETTFRDHLKRLIHKPEQSRSAKTVEVFGWLILVEGTLILLAPHFVAKLIRLPELSERAAHYLQLGGLLIGGLGMLYVASGRLDSRGFVFASLLDRPLVPPIMAVLWYLGIVPGPLALLFALSDGLSFLWTLAAWRSETRGASG